METSNLETVLLEVRSLAPDAQRRVTLALEEMVAQAKCEAAHDQTLRDPMFRASVQSALAESEEDRVAGRTRPFETAMDAMEKAFADKHGL